MHAQRPIYNFTGLGYISPDQTPKIVESANSLFLEYHPEKPGAFTHINAPHKRNITSSNYRYADSQTSHDIIRHSLSRAASYITVMRIVATAILAIFNLTDQHLLSSTSQMVDAPVI